MIVAIDGPAGSGKSSVARCVANRLGLYYLNSGLYYRAITWAVLQAGVSLEARESVGKLASRLSLKPADGGLIVDGVERRGELRTPEVDRAVAHLSGIHEVRETVNQHLRSAADEREVVAEGRDMTTVVFPDADVKVYLDASLEARARRRLGEQGGEDLARMMHLISERDRIDQEKAFGPLIRSPEALYIDTSGLTLNQVCDTLLRTIHST